MEVADTVIVGNMLSVLFPKSVVHSMFLHGLNKRVWALLSIHIYFKKVAEFVYIVRLYYSDACHYISCCPMAKVLHMHAKDRVQS